MRKYINYLKQFNWFNYIVAIFFVCSPLESIELGDGFSLTKLSALLVLFVWALRRFPYHRSPMIMSFWYLFGYSLLTVVWAIDRENTISQIASFLLPSILVAIAIKESISKKDDIVFYMGGYVIGSIISAGAGYFMRDAVLAAAAYAAQERLTAFGADQNAFAYLLNVGVACVLCCFGSTTIKWLRYFCLASLGLFIIIILSTGSRTGMVLLVMTIGGFMVSKKSFKSFAILGIAGVLAAPFIINYIPESIWERLFETNELVESGNFSERGDIWAMGFSALAEENFVTGVGYSNFTNMLRRHFGSNWASHNTYLTYLCEFGIVGIWVFIGLLKRIYYYAKANYRLSGNFFFFFFFLPLLVVMFTLETEYKRWIFLIGVLLESWYVLSSNEYRIKK